jgi:ABC-type antimicrobial peptide transport system permease subunit
VLGEIEPGSAVLSATPLRELLSGPLARPRFVTAMLGSFASLAVVLAAIGLYGTMASMVARRRREIAVRMALGSTPGGIRRLIVTRGLAITALGLAAGSLLAVTGTRWLGSLLFGVGPLDLPVLLMTAGFLFGVAAIACYFPSGRAAAVPPASALRAE